MTVSQQIEDLTSRKDSYVLLQRFHMPTKDGPQDAIAVTSEVSKILLSFYTIMMGFIMLQLWYLAVLVGIAIFAKSKRLTRNMGVANVAIWNSPAPLSVIKAMFDYSSRIPLYALMWAAAAALAWAGSFAMSLLVSPELIIGAAAPANLQSIYVPEVPQGNLSSVFLRWLSLQVPSNLRAIEVLEALDTKTGQATNTSSFSVIVQDPQISTDSNGRQVYQVDYSYNLNEVDFGLQNVKDLSLVAQGSCVTEYNWYNNSQVDNVTNVIYDTYYPYGSIPDNISVSLSDGKPPLAFIFVPQNQSGANISFAAIVSSVQRRSFTLGSDPLYLTQPRPADPAGAGYEVQTKRPALSCWQQDMWTHNGQSKGTNEIEQLDVLPTALVDVFKQTLGLPRIISLAQALGTSTLKSAATSQGYYFDAQASNLHDDLERLVLGAYIATKNTLTETTMFSNIYSSEIPNLAFDQSVKQFKDGAADFVIYGSSFAALRINFLIVIPVITVVLWLTVYLLTDNPFFPLPWAYVNALKAPVLYSAVDVETFRNDHESGWRRKSQAPYYKEKDTLAHVRPKYDKERRIFSWHSHTHEQGNANGTSDAEASTMISDKPKVSPAVSPVVPPAAAPEAGI